MKKDIKKMFLCVILIIIGIMVFEAIFVLAILFFYMFLEFAFTTFMIGENAKCLLFILYASCGIVAFFGINFLCVIKSADNYEKIKNKILEWIK